jgi:hypothetical protein
MKLTPWFPPEIKPAYPGVYQVKQPRFVWYRRWDGEYWFSGGHTPEDAASSKCAITMNAHSWRGLAKPPKGWTK